MPVSLSPATAIGAYERVAGFGRKQHVPNEGLWVIQVRVLNGVHCGTCWSCDSRNRRQSSAS